MQLLTFCHRVRRVKCDETKPVCRNCAKLGRSCTGYHEPEVPKTSHETHYRRIQPKDGQDVESVPILTAAHQPWYYVLRDLDANQASALTFFRHHTARELRGCSELQLWERWAMQLCHREPAIMHGLIAVGAIHRLTTKRGESSNAETDKQMALCSYGRAISQLSNSIASSQGPFDASVVLFACLIFFCFEMLNDDGTVAMQHLQGGLNILRGQKATSQIRLRARPCNILEDLIAAFAMLDFDNAMFSFQRVQPPLAHFH